VVIKKNSCLLLVRIVQDLAVEGATIDLGTLARTEHEKRRQQHDRNFDREDDNDVPPEIVHGHDRLIGYSAISGLIAETPLVAELAEPGRFGIDLDQRCRLLI
jgi:hypothetical protein